VTAKIAANVFVAGPTKRGPGHSSPIRGKEKLIG
jgi:hypothetical protein